MKLFIQDLCKLMIDEFSLRQEFFNNHWLGVLIICGVSLFLGILLGMWKSIKG
jgi:hypothetical protein